MADPTARFVISGTDATSAAFRSASRGLDGIARSARSFRSLMAGFGISIGVRELTRWSGAAIKAADLTREQRALVDAAAGSWKALHHEMQNAAGQAAAMMSGDFRRLTEFLRKGIFPTDAEAIFTGTTQATKGLKTELGALEAQLRVQEGARNNFLGNLFGVDYEENIAELQKKIGSLRTSISQMEASLKPKSSVLPKPAALTAPWLTTYERFGHIRGALDGQLMQRPNVRLDFLDELQEATVAAKEFADASAFFTDRRAFRESLGLSDFDFAGAIKMTDEFKKQFAEIKDAGLDAARFVGGSFEDAFKGFLVGSELRFKDLLRQMAIDLGASAFFSMLGSAFPGVPILGRLFGGSRASGGSTRGGMVYKVHPGEAFFTSPMDGRVGAADGGDVVIYQTNTFSGGDSREQAAAIAANNARLERSIRAQIVDARRRGRPG